MIAFDHQGVRASIGRISAMVLRYAFLMRNSWPRLLELVYWPAMQMVLWGFITQFLMTNSSWVAQAAGLLIAAVLLWDVLFRGQLGVSLTFFEEMYSRNLGHLFVSPLRPQELVAAMLFVSMVRTLIGVGGAAVLAIPLYHYSVFQLGLPLVGFFANLLIFAWSVGLLVSALVLRNGLGAENLAWALILGSLRSAASIIRFMSYRNGYKLSPQRCLRAMSSKACERF